MATARTTSTATTSRATTSRPSAAPATGEGKLSCPHGIWCDTRDAENPTILVADRANVRLQWFTLDGKFIKMVKDELRHPVPFRSAGGDMLIPDLQGRV